jgi:hypothetical protein
MESALISGGVRNGRTGAVGVAPGGATGGRRPTGG